VQPLGHLAGDLLGDPADRVLADLGAVHLLEMRGDLTGRQPTRRERQHDLIDPCEPSLALADDLRLERRLSVPRDLDLDRPDLREHRLGACPVTAVAAVASCRVVLLVAEVLAHLGVQRRLEHALGQLAQQPARADQLDVLLSRLLQQLLSKLSLINRIHVHRLDHLVLIGQIG
jgi:hypothetical protein